MNYRLFQQAYISAAVMFVFIHWKLYGAKPGHVTAALWICVGVAIYGSGAAFVLPEVLRRSAEKTPGKIRQLEQGANLAYLASALLVVIAGFLAGVLGQPIKVSLLFYAAGLAFLVSFRPVSFDREA